MIALGHPGQRSRAPREFSQWRIPPRDNATLLRLAAIDLVPRKGKPGPSACTLIYQAFSPRLRRVSTTAVAQKTRSNCPSCAPQNAPQPTLTIAGFSPVWRCEVLLSALKLCNIFLRRLCGDANENPSHRTVVDAYPYNCAGSSGHWARGRTTQWFHTRTNNLTLGRPTLQSRGLFLRRCHSKRTMCCPGQNTPLQGVVVGWGRAHPVH